MFEYFLFLFPLLGVAYPIYIFTIFKLLVIKINEVTFLKFDLLFVLFLIFYIFLRLFYVSIDAVIYLSTYYFGFLFFYFYFFISQRKIDLYLLLKILCYEIIIETILINTIIPASILPNYPEYTLDSPHHKLFFGFFQRPYSFGSNASVTSTIILILYTYVRSNFKFDKKNEILVLLALLFCLSGTGIAMYFIFILFSNFKYKPKNIFIFLGLILFSILSYPIIEQSDFSKFSSIYINGLYDLKIQQIENYILSLNDSFQILFGKNHLYKFDVVTFNDFAFNDAFYNIGIIGLVLIFIFIMLKVNKSNLLMIIFFLIGAFHYGAMFSISGQLLLGYILNLSKSKKSINSFS